MSPRGGFQFEFDPQSLAQGIQLLNELFEGKVSKKARQTREALENIGKQKAWEWPQEYRQKYAQALQYQPGPLRSLLRPSERAPEYLLSEAPFEGRIKTLKGGVAPAPMDIPRPPRFELPTGEEFESAQKGLMDLGYDEKEARDGAREILTGLKREKPSKTEVVRFGANPQSGALEQYHVDVGTGEEIVGTRRPVWQAKETPAEKLADHIATLTKETELGFKQKPQTPAEKKKEFEEKETYKEKLRRERPVKEPKAPLPPGTDVQLRATLLRLYLTNSNVWIDKKAQEDAVTAVREGKLEEAYYLLNPDQQRTFEEVITMAEGYARKLGITKAINQALHDLQSRRPSAFQRQGGPPTIEPKREGAKSKGVTTPSGKTYTIEEVQ